MISLLDQVANITRESKVSDGQGGRTNPSVVTVASGVSCRVSVASGSDMNLAGQHKSVVSHAVYFDHEVDFTLKHGDVIMCDGSSYVVRVLNVSAPGYPYKKVLVEEYQ